MSKVEKNIRQNQESKVRNKSFLSAVKTAIKKAKIATAIQDPNMKKFVSEACAMIDKAETKNIFKKNKVNRLKSKLQSRLNKSERVTEERGAVAKKLEPLKNDKEKITSEKTSEK